MNREYNYEDYGLTKEGIDMALAIENSIEKLIEETNEVAENFYKNRGKGQMSPWYLRDFLYNCISAIVLNKENIEKYKRLKECP